MKCKICKIREETLDDNWCDECRDDSKKLRSIVMMLTVCKQLSSEVQNIISDEDFGIIVNLLDDIEHDFGGG